MFQSYDFKSEIFREISYFNPDNRYSDPRTGSIGGKLAVSGVVMPGSTKIVASAAKTLTVKKKELIKMLDAASVQYMDGGNFGRDGMISALNVAVAVLMIHLPVKVTERRRLLRPLTTLTRGLRAINNGNPPKFVKSEKKFGGVRLSPEKLVTMGIAAGVFKVLS